MNKPLSLLLVYIITTINAVQSEPTFEEICKFVAPGTTILHPNTCNQWIQCPSSFDGTDYDQGSCVYGLYFNKDTGRCENMENVRCPYQSKTIQNRCALKKDGTFLADPDNCKQYIFCQNGQEIISACPNQLNYHPQKGACVYSNEYQCPLNTAAANVSAICKSVPNNSVLADIRDCTKYSNCDNLNQLIELQCNEHEAFDYSTFKCVPQNAALCHPLAPELEPELDVCGTEGNVIVGYIADEESCSGYYICAKQGDGKPDRKPTHLQCQNGYFFDSNTWSCRNRLNVKCNLDRCEGMDNKYVNVAGDCTAYARCRNGITVASGKCEAGYYFDERSQVCTQQNISYTACML